MLRARTMALACAAALALVQVQAAGQEIKGQVKLGLHKVKMEAGKLYEVSLTHPDRTTLDVNVNGAQLIRTYDKNFRPGKMYLMPLESREYAVVVAAPVFGVTDQATIDYTLKFSQLTLAEKPLLSAKDKLADTDAKYKNGEKYYKPYKMQMKAGQVYLIDLVKDGVKDPYLYLEDAKGQIVTQDDDSGGELNARIVFVPQQDGEYTIIATTLRNETGGFNLTVRSTK